ncbi:hypothetical protein ACN6LL_002200 [Streptomyces violaceoruber]
MKLPWSKKAPIANQFVSKVNKSVFSEVQKSGRRNPTHVAKLYAETLIQQQEKLLKQQNGEGRYHIGLNVLPKDFSDVTKKALLVSDTLMLTQDAEGPVIPLGGSVTTRLDGGMDAIGQPSAVASFTNVGVQCQDLAGLGRWLLEAEPLLKTGAAWYLPRRVDSDSLHTHSSGNRELSRWSPAVPINYDFLIRDGRAIEASGVEPAASHVVRVLFNMKIPYLEGLTLRDFSRITVDEFDSYRDFKPAFRKRLLDIDDVIEDTQSQRKIAALEDEMRYGVAQVRTQMTKATKLRSVALLGATVCTTTVALLAVNKPALLPVVAALGVSTAGIWNLVTKFTEEGRAKAREGEWVYVWALMKDCEAL